MQKRCCRDDEEIYRVHLTSEIMSNVQSVICSHVVYLFSIIVELLVKLMKCWNIVVFSGLNVDEKFGLY